jgi:DNA-binding NtrC family response regulator
LHDVVSVIERSTDPHQPRTRVLVVDDDSDIAQAVGRKLAYVGYAVEVATAAWPIVERIHSDRADWDVVLLDVGLPEISGIDVLKQFRDSGSLASVVMLTGDATASTAATCLRAGAFHYLTKPCLPIELAEAVESAARHASLRRRLLGGGTPGTAALLIGESPAMRRLQAAVDRLATHDVAVLIEGESGTGKELVARALHAGGLADRPFLAINCSAIPETLIDTELFGHARGAFTGASVDRDGMFVEADGGMLFLDEIGDMPFHVQARLLRVLQEGEVRPVGSSTVRKVTVRVIAATHVNLADAVAAGRFREDLFYRLNVVALRVPPLRERLDDIPMLAAHFLRKHGGPEAPVLTPDALDALAADLWPGNVRELENAVVHALAFQHGPTLGIESLPPRLAALTRPSSRPPSGFDDSAHRLPLTEAKRQVNATFERAYLLNVLARAAGSMSEAARLAGIDRTNLRRLLKRHHIQPGTHRPRR